MGNRTISLSPICDLIRKEMIEQGIPFSLWVQEQLIEWNRTRGTLLVAAKPTVPWHYECQLCHQKGHHASECSMYNPKIERDEE